MDIFTWVIYAATEATTKVPRNGIGKPWNSIRVTQGTMFSWECCLRKREISSALKQPIGEAHNAPKDPCDEAYLNLGLVLRAQERYPEALECFERALKLTPDYSQALTAKNDLEKALVYLRTGEQKFKIDSEPERASRNVFNSPAAFPPKPGTSAICSTVASRMRCTEPNFFSNAALRRSPMLGNSSRMLSEIRLSRVARCRCWRSDAIRRARVAAISARRCRARAAAARFCRADRFPRTPSPAR